MRTPHIHKKNRTLRESLGGYRVISVYNYILFPLQDGEIDLKLLAKVLSPESEITEVRIAMSQ